jgi:hypothetical protein
MRGTFGAWGGWQAKAPAPQGRMFFDGKTGRTLSSVNPAFRRG